MGRAIMREDRESTDLAGAAYLARDSEPAPHKDRPTGAELAEDARQRRNAHPADCRCGSCVLVRSVFRSVFQ